MSSRAFRQSGASERKASGRTKAACGIGGGSLKIREVPIRHSREACLPRALRGIGTDVRQTRARTEDENKDTGRNPIPFEKRT